MICGKYVWLWPTKCLLMVKLLLFNKNMNSLTNMYNTNKGCLKIIGITSVDPTPFFDVLNIYMFIKYIFNIENFERGQFPQQSI